MIYGIVGEYKTILENNTLVSNIWRLIDIYYNCPDITPKIGCVKWVNKKLKNPMLQAEIHRSFWQEKRFDDKLDQTVAIITGYKENGFWGGKEKLRNIIIDNYNPDVWISALMYDYKPKPVVGVYNEGQNGWVEKYPNWIITDVRYPNEAKGIKDKGGKLIGICENKEDISENITCDYYIKYSEITDDLILSILEIMSNEKIIH